MKPRFVPVPLAVSAGVVFRLAALSSAELATDDSTAEGPVLCAQVDKLLIPGSSEAADVGYAVDVWNDTAVVGAYHEDANGEDSGAAYVFTLHHGGDPGWAYVTRLVPDGNAAGDQFGQSVAIHNDRIVVGAPRRNAGPEDAGSAFVFERNAGGASEWECVKTLVSGDPDDSDQFGSDVDIFDDKIIVGARYDDEAAGNAGAAYVFYRNEGGAGDWGQVAKLMANDADSNDYLGHAVAIYGSWAAAGAYQDEDVAPGAGSVYLYERNFGSADDWVRFTKITAPGGTNNNYFGRSLDLSHDMLVVGAYGNDDDGSNAGAAYVFERNTPGRDYWGLARRLQPQDLVAGDWFGYSVGISGDLVVVGAMNRAEGESGTGAAYLFKRNEGGPDDWSQAAKIRQLGGQVSDWMGRSVAICGNTIVCGGDGDDEAASSAGAAWVFRLQNGPWVQARKLEDPELGSSDHMGSSVAVADDMAVAGAPGHDVPGYANTGRAFIYERNEGGADRWGEQADHTYAPLVAAAAFGSACAAWGDRIAVGAKERDRVTLYERNESFKDQWNAVANVVGTDTESGDDFGAAIALYNDTLLVGAPFHDEVGASGCGAAYVFERNAGGEDRWDQVRKLTASDADTGSHFGRAVALYGDIALIGAPEHDAVDTNSGAAYVFERNAGGADNWGEVRQLNHSSVTGACYFGSAVGLYGGIAAVGAREHDGAAPDAGTVFVFDRNRWYKTGPTTSTNWAWVASLHQSCGPGYTNIDDDDFGNALAISRDTLVVAARYSSEAAANGGKLCVYERHHGGINAWGATARLWPNDIGSPDWFGYSCSMDGNHIAAGAYQHDGVADWSGAAYLFRRSPCPWPDTWIADIAVETDGAHVSWQSTNGLFYSLQRRASLTTGDWSDVSGAVFIAGSNTLSEVCDTGHPLPAAAFYRLKVEP